MALPSPLISAETNDLTAALGDPVSTATVAAGGDPAGTAGCVVIGGVGVDGVVV
jgi:hypothetical protein